MCGGAIIPTQGVSILRGRNYRQYAVGLVGTRTTVVNRTVLATYDPPRVLVPKRLPWIINMASKPQSSRSTMTLSQSVQYPGQESKWESSIAVSAESGTAGIASALASMRQEVASYLTNVVEASKEKEIVNQCDEYSNGNEDDPRRDES